MSDVNDIVSGGPSSTVAASAACNRAVNSFRVVLAVVIAFCATGGSVGGAQLYPGDASKDSAPAIIEYMAAAKPLPAGVFYIHSTLDTGTGVGGALIGNGQIDTARSDGSWKYAPACTVIIDARPKDNAEPLLRVRRACFRIQDIGLVGCRVYKNPDYRTAKSAGPLIEITQRGAEWPVGQTHINRVTLTNSEIGILHADDGTGGGHSDHTRAQIVVATVDYPVIIDDNQSVDHQFDIFVRGNGKTVIWAKQGGKVTARIQTIGHWERWLALGDPLPEGVQRNDMPIEQRKFPNKNSGYFNLFVDMDGGDSVESPIEELHEYKWSRPVVIIDGFMADSAVIKREPILLNPAKVRINIERSIKPAYTFRSD